MEEVDELKAAKLRIRELEKALSDVYTDWCLERAFLDIARERERDNRRGVTRRPHPALACQAPDQAHSLQKAA